jgi:hypothetical protein
MCDNGCNIPSAGAFPAPAALFCANKNAGTLPFLYFFSYGISFF